MYKVWQDTGINMLHANRAQQHTASGGGGVVPLPDSWPNGLFIYWQCVLRVLNSIAFAHTV